MVKDTTLHRNGPNERLQLFKAWVGTWYGSPDLSRFKAYHVWNKKYFGWKCYPTFWLGSIWTDSTNLAWKLSGQEAKRVSHKVQKSSTIKITRCRQGHSKNYKALVPIHKTCIQFTPTSSYAKVLVVATSIKLHWSITYRSNASDKISNSIPPPIHLLNLETSLYHYKQVGNNEASNKSLHLKATRMILKWILWIDIDPCPSIHSCLLIWQRFLESNCCWIMKLVKEDVMKHFVTSYSYK